MISVVVCSRDPQPCRRLEENIRETAGAAHEFIRVDNAAGNLSIFEAYEEGRSRAEGDILCFCHEDILLHTDGWGKRVAAHFDARPEIGLLGVTGGTALPLCPAPWWSAPPCNEHLVNLLQHWPSAEIPARPYRNPLPDPPPRSRDCTHPDGPVLRRAVAVDGLWFCVRAALFDEIAFDTDTFDGFHAYDVDLCLQVGRLSGVAVVFDILVEHFSAGDLRGEGFYEASLALSRKWRSVLPVSVEPLAPDVYPRWEGEALLTFCYWMRSAGCPDRRIREVVDEFLPLVPNADTESDPWSLLDEWRRRGFTTTRLLRRVRRLVGGRDRP